MNTLWKRLQWIAEDQGQDLPAPGTYFQKLLDLSSGRVTQIKNDPTAELGEKSMARLVSLGYSRDWVKYGGEIAPKVLNGLFALGNTEPGPDIRGKVPLISWVQAGAFNEAADWFQPGQAEDWLDCPKRNGANTYALRVRGDSMTAPHGKTYPDGCIIFVDPDKRSPVTGDRIIAKLDGSPEVTFKVFVQDAGRTWLRALNPQYPPIMDPFKVIGTVIGKWEDE